jgi:hypothetical protein
MMRRLLSFVALVLALAAPAAAQSVQTFGGMVAYPDIPDSSDPLLSSNTIDAAGEKFACVIRAPQTGTLDKFEFMTQTVTSAQTLRVSFQDLDASGDPDGTQDQYRDIASGSVTSNTWTVPGLMTTDGTDGGVKRSVTRGDMLAMVIEFASTAGNLGIARFNSTTSPTLADFYGDHFTASWAKVASPCNVALKYDDGTYAYIGPGWSAISTNPPSSISISTSTTPDEAGNIVTVPFKASIAGAWIIVDLDQAGDVVLYDSDGTTALRTVSLSASRRSGTGAAISLVRFPTSYTASINASYRIVFKPTTTSAINLREFVVNSAEILDAYTGGQDVHKTVRTDAGSWTETTTRRVYIGLMLDGLGDNVSSGGGGLPWVIR